MKINISGGLALLMIAAFPALLRAQALVASGITEPFLHADLSASVPGIVTARHFAEGDSVKQGEAILELDKSLEELEKKRRTLVADDKKMDFDSTAVLFQKTTSVAKEEMLKKESDYKVACAERDIATEQLKRRVITAPFSGQVTEITIEIGEACQPYQPVVRLVDTSRCYFVSNLEAKIAARLALDQVVTLKVDTGASAASVNAKVIFISPVVDPASGLVRVRAVFENPSGKIRPGLAANMTVP